MRRPTPLICASNSIRSCRARKERGMPDSSSWFSSNRELVALSKAWFATIEAQSSAGLFCLSFLFPRCPRQPRYIRPDSDFAQVKREKFSAKAAPISRQQDDGRQWCGYRLVRDASKDTTARIKVGYAFSSIFLPPGRSIAQRMPPLSPALNRPEGLRPERTLVFGSIFTFTTRKRTYRLSADLQPGALK